MKRVIRRGLWESNSSSMHTVTIRGKWDGDVRHYNTDEVLEVTLDEYGWNGDPCDGFESKLAYALSMVLYTEYPGFNPYDEDFTIDYDVLEGLDGYQKLLKAVRNHCNYRIILIRKRHNDFYPYGYIDHQSVEGYSSLQDFLDDWNIDIERFLYDGNVVIHIDNDNH